jgi:hypothetical protein
VFMYIWNVHNYFVMSRAVVTNLWYAYPGGTRRTGLVFAKIILVMAENTKKEKELK